MKGSGRGIGFAFALLTGVAIVSLTQRFVSASNSKYSALCVVGRDENAYVREWAEYHLCLGQCSPC